MQQAKYENIIIKQAE